MQRPRTSFGFGKKPPPALSRLGLPAETSRQLSRSRGQDRRGLVAALLIAFAAIAVSVSLQVADRPALAPASIAVAAIEVPPTAEPTPEPVLTPTPAPPVPSPAPTLEVSPAYVAAPAPAPVVPVSAPLASRLRIPRIGVDAPLVTLSLAPNGQMPAPTDDSSVAWYDFSAAPGRPGNALLAGHVDWVDHAAVFWHLRTLAPGDSIYVASNGQTHLYVVDQVYSVPFDIADTSSIVGRRSGPPTLTIVTCAGTFNAARHLYDQRLVVVSSLRS